MATVIEFLVDRGTPFLVLPQPAATSIEETAEANGIAMDEVTRCELVMSGIGAALMVIPAERLLDLELVRTAVHDRDARKATQEEIRSAAADADPDALPPLSVYVSAPMFVDPAVAAMDQIIFPAGRRTVLAVVERTELFRDQPSVIVPLTSESSLPGDRVSPARRTALEQDEQLPPVHLNHGDDSPEDGSPGGDSEDGNSGNDAGGPGGRFMTGR